MITHRVKYKAIPLAIMHTSKSISSRTVGDVLVLLWEGVLVEVAVVGVAVETMGGAL